MWFSSSLQFGTNLKIYNGTYWPTEQKKASKILARLLLRVLQLGNRQTTPDIFSHQNRKRALGEGTVCLAALRCDPHGGGKKDGRRNARFGWDGAWRAAVFKPDEVDYRVIAALSLFFLPQFNLVSSPSSVFYYHSSRMHKWCGCTQVALNAKSASERVEPWIIIIITTETLFI